MAAIPTSLNANIQASTKELWVSTVKSQVLLKMPILARMVLDNRVTVSGKALTRPVDKAELDDQGQWYGTEDTMVAQQKTFLENPVFKCNKKVQVPIIYDVDEELENSGESAVLDLVPYKVKKAQRAMRIKMYRAMYDIADDNSTTTLLGTDGGSRMQSIRCALKHDQTYGTVSRGTTATNMWWQGASLSYTFSADGTAYADQATARSASVATFRKALAACQAWAPENPSEWLCVVGPDIYQKFKSEVDGRKMDTSGSRLVKYGFTAFLLDGVEVVMDPYLINARATSSNTWMFLLHIPDWEFRTHSKRNFLMRNFQYQGMTPNGLDRYLARIQWAGNFVCWQPNASIWLSNVS